MPNVTTVHGTQIFSIFREIFFSAVYRVPCDFSAGVLFQPNMKIEDRTPRPRALRGAGDRISLSSIVRGRFILAGFHKNIYKEKHYWPIDCTTLDSEIRSPPSPPVQCWASPRTPRSNVAVVFDKF